MSPGAAAEPFVYGPVLEALRTICAPIGRLSPVAGALRPPLPELAELLPPQPHQTGRPLEFRTIRELLDACGPTLLVLDDVHRADEHTHDLLPFLLSRPSARLGIVLVAERPHTLSLRPSPGVRWARLEPGPLAAADLRRLAVSSLGCQPATRPPSTRHTRRTRTCRCTTRRHSRGTRRTGAAGRRRPESP
ncbi:AAA family ATPase [Amycolatopsis sp.]|uniref:AAA family ATPase n=1 Tax=Amycolatopsis sp. TaxID=37632 RepID=UPI0039C8930A